jgi:hypothetical protein
MTDIHNGSGYEPLLVAGIPPVALESNNPPRLTESQSNFVSEQRI